MADQENWKSLMVLDFTGITGAEEERAQFYLQSSNWELNVALEMFYDDSSDDIGNDIPQNIPQNDDAKITVGLPSTQSANKSTSSTTRKGNANIFSLSSYEGDDASENSEREAYYAGGSENSGQQILGPDKKTKNPIENVFEAARRHGAEEVVPEQGTSEKPERNFFSGAGYKLGSDIEPSQQVSMSLPTQQQERISENVTIKFWSNGFSVDSGPLRDFNDPANKKFMDSISKGEVPSELRQAVRNAEVHVNMEDHREEEYVKPKQNLKAFSGLGQMLSSPTPNIIQEVSTPTPPLSENNPNSTFKVNESKPVTSIQIRLSDGTRLVAKFNHDSTVGDIRNIVRNARPNTGNFNLMTTFPNKILTDDNISIVDAKLLNAVIVQRMI